MTHRYAKIVATVGPASRAPGTLKLLAEVGVNAFRLNFSHGSHDDHAKAIVALRTIQTELDRPVCIIADMQGPKLRVGEFDGGKIMLNYGDTVKLTLGSQQKAPGTIPINHPELFDVLDKGHQLKFDDGKLLVTIAQRVSDGLLAKVEVPGQLSNKKGINVLGVKLPLPAITQKDREDMAFAISQGVDYIALSFVQSAQDVSDARTIIGTLAGIIVKIEKPSAMEELADILSLADAVMVARGDLGVELPLERVPVVQRQIIRQARALGKPVIVATHMLESMIDSPTPTRAEASDVATAIYQGADAVMLSAETAVGRHPATAVAIMDRIIRAAESDPEFWSYFRDRRMNLDATAEDAISRSVRGIAETMGCAAVFGYTATGSTVSRISRERPPCLIIGLTPNPTTAARLVLNWGVVPVVTADPNNFDDMLLRIQTMAQDTFQLASGDTFMIAAGIPFGRPGTTDTLKIAMVD